MTVEYFEANEAGVSVNPEDKELFLTLQAPKPGCGNEYINLDLRLPYETALDLINLMIKMMSGVPVEVSNGGDCEAYLSENMSEKGADAFYGRDEE